VVSFTKIQEAIRKNCPDDLATVLARRSMCRIANAIAFRNGAGAILTGDCLGQVASQTMEAMRVTEEASELPLLRPLVGMDKEEVSRLARRIGTFETSILPFEDCCGVFTPKHPQTKPKLDPVLAAEKLFDYAGLEAETLLNVEKINE
jgi:thiamine biosynthesis protein ThiI